MSEAKLKFDEEKHMYTLGNERLPSVTQLMKDFSNFDAIPKNILERKTKIGTFTHLAIELYLLGTLDESTLHPDVAIYFNSWLNWWNENKHRIKVLGIEKRFYHPIYKYAGTIDLHCLWDDVETVIDWKTAIEFSIWYEAQTAAYQDGLNHAEGAKVEKRGALKIKKDGTCEMHWHEDKTDFAAFAGLANFHNWRLNHDTEYAEQFTSIH